MKLSKQDYTVGWICALPIEKAAAIAVLDEKHDELPAAPSEEDSNIYTVGRIGKHNVVIVCLPAGNYGTNSAATVATNLRRSFPSLRFGLMVGIGGGVPNDENDVRLGDIVVSQPLHGTSGVVQYDLGKRVGEDTFHRTGWLNAPPTILLNASASLQAEKSLYQLGNSITAIATEAENKDDRFSYPNTEDHLYHANYSHIEGTGRQRNTCAKCGSSQRVVREQRERDDPVVHYGIIASGNQVIKDAIARDKIGKEAKAICFEMEAAGLMNHFPCLVIRGICDYSDSHKNKAWQPYAAITAAAYTKELLNHVPSLDGPGSARTENIVDVSKSIQALASVSRDPEVEKTGIERRKDKLINGSYQWVKDHQTFKDWLTTGSQILHLIGGAGKGKTMIMIGLINEFESGTKIPRENDNELQETLFLPGPVYFSYFLCQGTNENLNSAHSVLKGLLLLLLRKHQNLAIHLQKRYDLIGADSFASMIDINLLQLVLFEILDDPSNPSVVFCIDALDECFVGNRDLMAFIRKSVDHSPRIKWLLSSRPHQDIIPNYAPASPKIRVEIILEENQDSVDLAIRAYIDTKVTELDLQKHYRWQDKLDLEKALKEKCGGTFLWVHLACKELESSQAFSYETVTILEQIPLELTSVYTRMIDQIEQLDIKTRSRCFDILAAAAVVYRPLRLEEMGTIAIMTDHLPDIRRLVKLCGCFLSVENDSVYFIHQSAKDYLVSDHSRIFTTAGTTSRHKKVFDSCIQKLSNPAVLKKDIAALGWPGTLYTEITTKQRSCVTKIAYACCYWARHLEAFVQIPSAIEICHISSFFQDYFLHWLEALSILGKLSDAIPQIDILEAIKWGNDHLQEILLDAKEFLRHNFSRIEQSPLQIYSSAFIFSPPRSLTRTMNTHRLSGWLDPESRGSSDETWSSRQNLILQGLQDCKVISATYSPDGKLIAAFCDQIHSAAIKIWNSANGLCLHVLPIPRPIYVNHSWLSFSSDNTLVSFYHREGPKIEVWDTNTGLAIQSFDLEIPYISNFVFSADWKLLGFRIPGYPYQKLDWSSAQILSIPGDGTDPPHSWDQLQLWNLMDGKCIKAFAVPPGSIVGLFFSDHTIIAGVLLKGIRPGEIMLWDLEADKAFHYRAGPRKRLLHGGSRANENNKVALSPNGETIAEIESSSRTIRVWRNVADQRYRQVLPGPRLDKNTDPYIKSLSFSGDSQLLLVVLVDRYGKSLPLVQIFDSSSWVCIQSLGSSELPTTGILGAEFCPIDPDLVVLTCRDGSVRIWNLVLGHDTKALEASQPTLHQYPMDSVLISPNSRFAASVAGLSEFATFHSHDYHFPLRRRKEAIIWNTSTGRSSGILEGFPRSQNLDSDSDIIFNPKDNTLISCSHTRGPRLRYQNLQEEMHNSRRIRVWDLEKGNCLKNFDLAGANDDRFEISTTINISNDTKFLATSGSGSSLDTVQLWSLHNGDCLHSFPRSSRCGEYPIVEFSPDDKYIAISRWVGSAEIGSGSFEVRETTIGHAIGLFGMHSTEVISIVFSSARNMIVSASINGDIQLFDLGNKLNHETTDGSIPHHLHTQRFNARFGEGGHYSNLMKDSDCQPDMKDQAFEFLQKKSCLSIAFSPNEKTLVVAGYGRYIELWDITTEKCFRLQSFRKDKYQKFSRHFAVIERPRIEFLDDSDVFVWGPAHLTNRIIVPTASTFPDRVGVVHSGELIPVTKNSVFLDTDGLYVHGRRLLDISATYRPVKFDFKDGLFAIGCSDGRVYSIKVNLDRLSEPVA